MVVHESFVTRKPFEFTIIVLLIIFILLVPVYFLTKRTPEPARSDEVLTETYEEVDYLFGPQSDLTDSEKKTLFRINYEGHTVQWTGTLLSCSEMTPLYRVSVDHHGNGFGDVLFTTDQNCTSISPGTTVTYSITLIDLKIRTFTGKNGVIL
ncbi:hypothetical protein KY363_05865 [Candidatus Woesearchaeota archaeon]|nr:hypothetical protein [Candidatus Woesearchaeota archaeon]